MAVRRATKKASPSQAFPTLCIYGPTGSGKSILQLAFFEWFSQFYPSKKALVIDTEHSTDFYGVDVPARSFHPKAFQFETFEEPTRQVVELLDFIEGLTAEDPYFGVGIDSISPVWDSCFDLYTGKRIGGPGGKIPFHGYQVVKKPWRRMMDIGIHAPFAFVFTGREATAFDKDEDGEMAPKGTKPRAEKEAGYEPSMTIRCFQEREEKNQPFAIKAYVEKDRSGIWTGKTLDLTSRNPTEYAKKIDSLFRPMYELLVSPSEASHPQGYEEEAEGAVGKMKKAEEDKENDSVALYTKILQALNASQSIEELKLAWSMTNRNIMKLGDERYDALMATKDSRKIAIQTAAAAVAMP